MIGEREVAEYHHMRAEALLPWDFDGRIAPTRDNRDVVLVREVNPFAWKGAQSVTLPYLRSERADLAAGGRARSHIEAHGRREG